MNDNQAWQLMTWTGYRNQYNFSEFLSVQGQISVHFLAVHGQKSVHFLSVHCQK